MAGVGSQPDPGYDGRREAERDFDLEALRQAMQTSTGNGAADLDLALAIEASRREAEAQQAAQRARGAAVPSDSNMHALFEESRRLAVDSESRRRKTIEEEEERQLQEALARSTMEGFGPVAVNNEEDELMRAIRESEEQLAAEKEKKRKEQETEDSTDLFKAALRASCIDLGPRGVSQAAKIFATGDSSLGQPKTGTATACAGSRYVRGANSQSTKNLAPSKSGLLRADVGTPPDTTAAASPQKLGAAVKSISSSGGPGSASKSSLQSAGRAAVSTGTGTGTQAKAKAKSAGSGKVLGGLSRIGTAKGGALPVGSPESGAAASA
eukprot:TRINITY_DN35367_c0_g1_i1.p1 TRINITY_DN35367_c0_g1~~TRINITY_DN35367_c0_g1_i1.p1  ORF type:complete len:325 (+),score=86.90 TRINITY_DN35367_c0_g1_i1:147-1121(+)